ncbi:N4 gp52-like protein [Pseudomonas phage LUZ7]|uniref:N4 gp52-like protein n=1 Tax=Pseudomonas phage LUZ7 TaxID=655097 RepID=C8ZKH4_9CAUD|nr:N4 gp52-like protein [Pseudomonas phage LUZ7]CAZ66216.1 N4 gp52-like protein [Pseudomonas phage LUZ7]
MAYPYSNNPFGVELDLSTLGSFGLGGPQTNIQMPSINVGAEAAPAQGLANLMSGFGGFFNQESMFGGVSESGARTGGWVMPALGIGQALMGMQAGKRQEKFARDQLAESRRQFDLNFGAQRQSINTQMEDRQRARVASNAGAYESVDKYMERNRIR